MKRMPRSWATTAIPTSLIRTDTDMVTNTEINTETKTETKTEISTEISTEINTETKTEIYRTLLTQT